LEGGSVILSVEENKMLTETDPGTPMGELLRRSWLPAMPSEELPVDDEHSMHYRLRYNYDVLYNGAQDVRPTR
jgi:hypothetical protein